MKIKYFGQSLIIDLSEINSPAKQTYLAYIPGGGGGEALTYNDSIGMCGP